MNDWRPYLTDSPPVNMRTFPCSGRIRLRIRIARNTKERCKMLLLTGFYEFKDEVDDRKGAPCWLDDIVIGFDAKKGRRKFIGRFQFLLLILSNIISAESSRSVLGHTWYQSLPLCVQHHSRASKLLSFAFDQFQEICATDFNRYIKRFLLRRIIFHVGVYERLRHVDFFLTTHLALP